MTAMQISYTVNRANDSVTNPHTHTFHAHEEHINNTSNSLGMLCMVIPQIDSNAIILCMHLSPMFHKGGKFHRK